MIESMTGYGSGKAQLAGNVVDVWLRSVNNRTFKLTVRLPEILLKAQQELEELIKGSIARGTVYCQVDVGGPLAGACTIEETTFLDYCRRLRSLARKAGLSDDIRIEHVASLPGALKEAKASGGKLRDLLLKAAGKALRALVKSRRGEGEKIEKELRVLLERSVALCNRVDKDRKKSLRNHMKRLADRMKELLSETGLKTSSADITREAAILAERSDIAEELQRLKMHTQQLAKALSSQKPVGRRLEFIAQEMLREANTMSAKSASTSLVVPLLELKGSIDRVREQAQNVQ